jgi:hypothetical protein
MKTNALWNRTLHLLALAMVGAMLFTAAPAAQPGPRTNPPPK